MCCAHRTLEQAISPLVRARAAWHARRVPRAAVRLVAAAAVVVLMLTVTSAMRSGTCRNRRQARVPDRSAAEVRAAAPFQ